MSCVQHEAELAAALIRIRELEANARSVAKAHATQVETLKGENTALADALEALLASYREMNAPISATNPLTRSDRDALEHREGKAVAKASDALSAAGRLP